jgi:hypothetical protein
MISVHKRSGKRHLVNEEHGTTLCGRTLYRRNWRKLDPRAEAGCECLQCQRVLAAQLGIAPVLPNRWASA